MNWFYTRNGVQQGPHTEAEIRALLGQLVLSQTDLVWREGLAGWIPIHQALGMPGAVGAMPPPYHAVAQQKSRVAFILFGLFLGTLGVHNFYAGYVGRGIAQLLITFLSFGVLVPGVWIWNLIEIIVVTRDSRGMALS